MDQKRIILFAACSGAIAVALGAFGAHGLEKLVENGSLDAGDLKTYETAVRYQFYHTFALFLLPAVGAYLRDKPAKIAARCFMGGILIFSGSLYLLSLSPVLFSQKLTWLGAITPLGGVLFIAGWISLFLAALKKDK